MTLGGSRHYESWNTDIDPHDSAGIWERCTSLLPNLKHAKVEKEFVGLRPHRDPIRVEKETLEQDGKHSVIQVTLLIHYIAQ